MVRGIAGAALTATDWMLSRPIREMWCGITLMAQQAKLSVLWCSIMSDCLPDWLTG